MLNVSCCVTLNAIRHSILGRAIPGYTGTIPSYHKSIGGTRQLAAQRTPAVVFGFAIPILQGFMVKQTHLVQSENLWEKEAAMPNSWVDINVDGQTMEGYLTQPETE
jgi:hypothetical protein